MSNKLTLLENICMKLGSLPGLGFLQDFVFNAGVAHKSVGDRVDDNMNVVEHVKGIGRDAKDLASKDTSKAKNTSKSK